jgi:response regulator RpfG family c-di-GMP phosphodiesterase
MATIIRRDQQGVAKVSDNASTATSTLVSPEKILLVDDEKNVLAAIHRQLRKEFNLLPALGGEQALQMLDTHKPAVVVCDMRMPGLSGVETLAEFEKRSPKTVRIMLTGNSDQETAVEAINKGKIFRFLNKPCPDAVLRQALLDALRFYQLVDAEQALLQQTLTGSIRALVDVMSLSLPHEFEKANRARAWAQSLGQALELESVWELEVAAMLHPLGMVALPPELVEKARRAPHTLTAKESTALASAPESGRRLLMHIPRLEHVAQAIGLQDRNYDGTGYPDDGPSGDQIPILARALHVLKALSNTTTTEVPSDAAVAKLQNRGVEYDLRVLAAAHKLWSIGPGPRLSDTSEGSKPSRLKVTLDTILPSDLLVTPIKLESGKLLLSDGLRVTGAQIERLRHIRRLESIVEPIEVERIASATA